MIFDRFFVHLYLFNGSLMSSCKASFLQSTLQFVGIIPCFKDSTFSRKILVMKLNQQRIRYFLDKIQNDEDIWQTFNNFCRVNKEIQSKDIPSLEPLINEIFVDKNVLLNL